MLITINKRGLNFVVWDKKSKTVIDSVAFDTFAANQVTRKDFSLYWTAAECPAGGLEINVNSCDNTSELYSKVDDLMNENMLLSKKETRLEDQPAVYENSCSRRITKPLRSMMNLFRKQFGKKQ